MIKASLALTKDMQLAEDITQEASIRIFLYYNPITEIEFCKLINSIVKSCYIDHYRMTRAFKRDSSRTMSLCQIGEPLSMAYVPIKILEQEQPIQRIEEKQSVVLIKKLIAERFPGKIDYMLDYYRGMSAKEVAIKYNIRSELIHSDRTKIKKYIKENFPEYLNLIQD